MPHTEELRGPGEEGRYRALLERYRLALAGGRVTVWEWDAATDRIVGEDDTLSTQYGFIARPPQSPTQWFAAVHPADRESVLTQWTALVEGAADTAEFECRLVGDDGQVWWHSTRCIVSEHEDGRVRHIVGVSSDITERKQSEEALRLSEARYRALFGRYKLASTSGRVGVWEWDAETDAIGSEDVELAEMLGFDPTRRQTGARWREAIHPEDRDRVLAVWTAILEGPSDEATSEYRVVSDNGRVWWQHTRYIVSARQDGRVRRIVGVTSDITERKQAEEALRESEQRYRAFFDLNGVGATETRVPSGQFLRVNDALCTLTGYSREELLQLRFSDLAHPDDLEASVEQFQQLTGSEPQHYALEKRFRRKDGDVRWVRIEVSPGPADHGPPAYAIAIVQDITDRRRAIQALEEMNRRYKLATSVGLVLVWEWDADTDAVSVESHQPSEIVPERVSGAELPRTIHPDDRDRVLSTWRSVTSGAADGAEFEYRFVALDGTVSWLHTRFRPSEYRVGRVHRILGVSVDVTERKEAEERYRAFFELNAVATGEVDLADGHFLRVNKAYCQMLDYSRDELLALSFADISHPDEQEANMQVFGQLVRGEIPDAHMEKRYIRKDGSTIWVQLAITLIKDHAGMPISELALALDITERKRAEEEIQRLANRLLQVQDEERRRIAQELHDQSAQALVASNLNLADLLETRADLDEVQIRVRESLDLCSQVLEQIRTLSYVLHPPLLDEIGLVSAVAWYVDNFSKRSGIAVDLIMPPDLARLPSVVETALFRVVQESLTNIRRHAGSERAWVRFDRDEERIILEVSDQGRGMAAGKMQSRGVGIASMQQRIGRLGGHLDIHSTPAGTTVTAVVPLNGVLSDD